MFKIAALIFTIVGTTLSGIIITAVLSVPGLADSKPLLIIASAVGGYVIAIPLSLVIGNRIQKTGGLTA